MGKAFPVSGLGSEMSNYGAKRSDIQYLRAFAVACVVIFHARQSYLPNGYLGVDIFFFISGFVLTPQLMTIFLADKNQIKSKIGIFFSKRFKRLIPAFVLSVIFSTFLIFLLGSSSSLQKSSEQALKSLFFLGNINTESLLGNYFNPIPNPFLHFWSLSAEWQIYFLIPILFFAISAIKTKRDKKLLTLLLSLLALFSISAGLIGSQNISIFGYYSPLIRIWQFALGSLAFIYLCNKDLSLKWKKFARFVLGISIFILLSPIQLDKISAWLIASIVFFSSILGRPGEYKFIGKVLSWLGDRSYSIYLYHMPFIYLAIHSPMSASNQYFRILGVVLAISITLVVAHFSFLYAEGFLKPIQVSPSRILSLSFLAFVILVATLTASSMNLSWMNNSRSSVAWNQMTRCFDGNQVGCTVAENSRPRSSILVIGDSHAQHYFSSFHEFGIRENIDIKYSTSFNFKSIQEMDPKLIVISKFHSTQDKNSLVKFQNLLQTLKSLEIPLIYVSDNPVFNDYMHYTHHLNPSFALILFEKLKIVDTPKKIVDISDIDLSAYDAGNSFKQIARKFALVVNPFEVLCSSNTCARYVKSDWVYWDDHHLSEFGADMVFSLIGPQILKTVDLNSESK